MTVSMLLAASLRSLLSGIAPSFIKAASEKIRPETKAECICLICALFACIRCMVRSSFPDFEFITNWALLYYLLSGLLYTGFIYFLCQALSCGEIGAVVPIINLKITVILTLLNAVTDNCFSIKMLFAFLILFVGTFFLEIRSGRKVSAKWVLFTFLSMIFLALSESCDRFLCSASIVSGEDFLVMMRLIISCCLLACINILKSSFSSIRKIHASDWLMLIAAGMGIGVCYLLMDSLDCIFNSIFFYGIYCVSFPVCLIGASAILKERYSVYSGIGAATVFAGMILIGFCII